jgi:hypothetical protein
MHWFARTPDHYVTRNGACVRVGGHWFARARNRVRGPLRDLDTAMDAVQQMLERQSREAA